MYPAGQRERVKTQTERNVPFLSDAYWLMDAVHDIDAVLGTVRLKPKLWAVSTIQTHDPFEIRFRSSSSTLWPKWLVDQHLKLCFIFKVVHKKKWQNEKKKKKQEKKERCTQQVRERVSSPKETYHAQRDGTSSSQGLSQENRAARSRGCPRGGSRCRIARTPKCRRPPLSLASAGCLQTKQCQLL